MRKVGDFSNISNPPHRGEGEEKNWEKLTKDTVENLRAGGALNGPRTGGTNRPRMVVTNLVVPERGKRNINNMARAAAHDVIRALLDKKIESSVLEQNPFCQKISDLLAKQVLESIQTEGIFNETGSFRGSYSLKIVENGELNPLLKEAVEECSDELSSNIVSQLKSRSIVEVTVHVNSVARMMQSNNPVETVPPLTDERLAKIGRRREDVILMENKGYDVFVRMES